MIKRQFLEKIMLEARNSMNFYKSEFLCTKGDTKKTVFKCINCLNSAFFVASQKKDDIEKISVLLKAFDKLEKYQKLLNY